jgi:hypothetical protein
MGPGKVFAVRAVAGAMTTIGYPLLLLVLRPPVGPARWVVLPFIGDMPLHLPKQPPHVLADKGNAVLVILAALLAA